IAAAESPLLPVRLALLAARPFFGARLLGRAITIVAEVALAAVERTRTIAMMAIAARMVAVTTVAMRTVAMSMVAVLTMRPLAVMIAVTLLATRLVMRRTLAAMAAWRAATLASAILRTLLALAMHGRGGLRQVFVGRRHQHGDALVGQPLDRL